MDKTDYINYVCPYCFRQLQDCTCKNIAWQLIHIDVKIQECIRQLNRKGYITRFCCSGHFGKSNQIYVAFFQDYHFDEIPKGFKVHKSNNMIDCKVHQTDNQKDFEAEQDEIIAELLRWINSLPDR